MRRARLPLFLCAMLSILGAFAQEGSLRGTLLTPLNEALPGATVRLINAVDTTQARFTTSDLDGTFGITRIDAGKYFLRVSMVGYERINMVVKVDGDLNLGKIIQKEDNRLLSEVTVKSDKVLLDS